MNCAKVQFIRLAHLSLVRRNIFGASIVNFVDCLFTAREWIVEADEVFVAGQMSAKAAVPAGEQLLREIFVTTCRQNEAM